MSKLTHIDESGQARMVDVSEKKDSFREAVARGSVAMRRETLLLVKKGALEKGDVLGVARVAGIMAAKRTAELIPLCHPLMLNSISCRFRFEEARNRIHIEFRVRTSAKTGVEMEALTAVSVAALTIYDMCKSADKELVIENIRLVKKTGGKTGDFIRKGEEPWKSDR